MRRPESAVLIPAVIHLDMMTIAIAAISMGIAVDDTIHYICRFEEEIKKDGDYLAAMHRLDKCPTAHRFLSDIMQSHVRETAR
jgi:hypothetical protein